MTSVHHLANSRAELPFPETNCLDIRLLSFVKVLKSVTECKYDLFNLLYVMINSVNPVNSV